MEDGYIDAGFLYFIFIYLIKEWIRRIERESMKVDDGNSSGWSITCQSSRKDHHRYFSHHNPGRWLISYIFDSCTDASWISASYFTFHFIFYEWLDRDTRTFIDLVISLIVFYDKIIIMLYIVKSIFKVASLIFEKIIESSSSFIRSISFLISRLISRREGNLRVLWFEKSWNCKRFPAIIGTL